MISNRKTRFYRFMRALLYLTTRLFYKRVAIKYVAPLPKDKPIIFVGNHLNTFIDPILISVNTGLYPAFLTKADVFKNPLIRRFLYSIRMLPIYRQRDGADFIKRNEVVFDTSIKQLEANLQFVIFGEGSHSSFRRLRDLKKGFARIGFEALERHNGVFDVYVVPVGVEYSHFQKMHQTVTQTYGEPISLRKYLPDYRENANQALMTVKNDVYEALQRLVIHIPTEEHYEVVESLRIVSRPWVYEHLGLKNPDPHQKMAAEQQLIAAQTAFEKAAPEKMNQFADIIRTYHSELKRLNFRQYLISDPLPDGLALFSQLFLLILFFPIFMLGVITSYLPFQAPVWFSKRTFKDPMYYGAINMSGGLLLFPVFWFLETLLVQLIWSNVLITLAFALLMPCSAWFALRYWIRLKKWWHRARFLQISQKDPNRIEQLRQQHDQILRKTQEIFNEYSRVQKISSTFSKL